MSLVHVSPSGSPLVLQKLLARDVAGSRFHADGARVVVDQGPDVVELQCMSIADAMGPRCNPMSQNVLVCFLSRYMYKLSLGEHVRMSALLPGPHPPPLLGAVRLRCRASPWPTASGASCDCSPSPSTPTSNGAAAEASGPLRS